MGGMRIRKRKVHISIPASIHDGLKVVAARDGRDVSDVIDEAARVLLEKRGLWPPSNGAGDGKSDGKGGAN